MKREKKELPNGRYTKEEPRKWRVTGPDGRYTYAVTVSGWKPEFSSRQEKRRDLDTWYKLREQGGSPEWLEKLDGIITGLEAVTSPPCPEIPKQPKHRADREPMICYQGGKRLQEDTSALTRPLRIAGIAHRFDMHKDKDKRVLRYPDHKDPASKDPLWWEDDYNLHGPPIEEWTKIPKGWYLIDKGDQWEAIKPYDFRGVAPQHIWKKLEQGPYMEPWPKDIEPRTFCPYCLELYKKMVAPVIKWEVWHFYKGPSSPFAKHAVFDGGDRVGCEDYKELIAESWIKVLDPAFIEQACSSKYLVSYVKTSLKKMYIDSFKRGESDNKNVDIRNYSSLNSKSEDPNYAYSMDAIEGDLRRVEHGGRVKMPNTTGYNKDYAAAVKEIPDTVYFDYAAPNRVYLQNHEDKLRRELEKLSPEEREGRILCEGIMEKASFCFPVDEKNEGQDFYDWFHRL